MTTDIALPPMRNLGPVRVSREPLGGHPAYARLLADAPLSGSCPVWVSEPDRLRVPRDLQATLAAVGRVDAETFLAARWTQNCPFCGCRDPFDEFPGVQAALAPAVDPVVAAARMAAGHGAAHLAILPVSRPADAVAALGWAGADDPEVADEDLAGMSAVLRSWEHRFGAMLVRMDASTLWVSVGSPPDTDEECHRVAAEHFTFCRDVDGEDARPLRDYAAALRANPTWRFRWD